MAHSIEVKYVPSPLGIAIKTPRIRSLSTVLVRSPSNNDCWYRRGSYCDNNTIRGVALDQIGYRAGRARDNDAVHKDRIIVNIEKDEPKNLNLQPAS
jgi:hypothetical protein